MNEKLDYKENGAQNNCQSDEDSKESCPKYSEETDWHWSEVMGLAEKYGFILQAAAGTATLITHKNQMEHFGEAEYLRIQQMNGHCPKDFGYAGCLQEDGKLKDCRNCWAAARGSKWVRFKKNEQYAPGFSGR